MVFNNLKFSYSSEDLKILSDFKINSRRILGFTIFLLFIILIGLFVIEKTAGLPSMGLQLIPFYILFNLLLVLLYFKNVNQTLLGHLEIVLLFLIFTSELHLDKQIFHEQIYWIACVPFLALILVGVVPALVWLFICVLSLVIFTMYVGANYSVQVQLTQYLSSGIFYLVSSFLAIILLYHLLSLNHQSIVSKSIEATQNHKLLEQKKLKLEHFQHILFRLSKNEFFSSHDLDEYFKIISLETSKELKINRIGIWLYEDEKSILTRRFMYDKTSGISKEKVKIEQVQFPTYFEAIETNDFILTDDALAFKSTSEFKEQFFQSKDKVYMLDVPISMDGKIIGVICCENKNTPTSWGSEEVLFMQSLSALISLALKTQEIVILGNEVHNQNKELAEKSNQISALNEELLSSNEELHSNNDSLEVAVRERTTLLTKQNKQLLEYAFINSHLLRAPLSRVMGLSYIIAMNKEKNITEDPEIIKALIVSSEELDNIVRRISYLLFNESDFSREEINEILDRNALT